MKIIREDSHLRSARKFVGISEEAFNFDRAPSRLAKFTPPHFAGILSLRLNLCNLASLPDWVARLNDLTEIDLSGNQFTRIPEEVLRLPKLKWIQMPYNELKEIDPRVFSLPSLEILNVSHNYITGIPREIELARKLMEVYISDNEVSEWPATIGRCPRLGTLAVSNNPMRAVPESLCDLPELHTIYTSRDQGMTNWEGLCANPDATTILTTMFGRKRMKAALEARKPIYTERGRSAGIGKVYRAGTIAPEIGSTRDLAIKLQELLERYPFEIASAKSDSVRLRLPAALDNPEPFARDLVAALAPDIEGDDEEHDIKLLCKAIATGKTFKLWWD